MKPLAVDLFCGLGGWSEGLLAEGWDCIGFDIERHQYGEHRYPAQLVLQDVLTLHGSQFKDAALIVASPPCQEFSYMAMPWSKAKQIEREYQSGERDRKKLTALFDACFRIQREASEAAGHHIPLVVENVRGAQKWVGRSRWNFGSFHLWGDVPALMPMTKAVLKGGWLSQANGAAMRRDDAYKTQGMNWSNQELRGQDFTRIAGQQAMDGRKVPGFRFDGSGRSFQSESVDRHIKNTGGSWFNIGSPGQKETNRNPVHELTMEGVKNKDADGYERNHPDAFGWKKPRTSSHSTARKAASAQIAKIPLPLARHIARVWFPAREMVA